MAEAAAGPVPGLGLTSRARTIALGVVLLAFFMDLLDATIVNVAIPAIQTDLGASYSAIQWIIAGYALAFAVFLITGGRLGDIFGYKPLFLLGMGGFTIASAICGFAPSTEVLIGARLLQGFMAAMMVPQILSTIQVMYTTAAERRNVSAAYGAAAGIATVAGPIIGALLITGDIFGLGWRTIFLVNIPVGLAALVLAWIYMPNAKAPQRMSVDVVGVAMIVVAMLALMFPLIQGRDLDWPWWTFAMMAAAAVLLIVFGWHQRWKERNDDSPLVVMSLFRKRSYAAGVVVGGTFFAIVAGYFLVQQLWLQVGLGYAPLKAGLTGIPFSIGVALAAGSAGPVLVPRLGRRALSIGAVVMALGFAWTLMSSRWFGGAITPWELAPSLFVSGLGMGMIIAPVYSFVLAEVPIRHAGSASGVVNAVGQIGGAIGVALIGVVFFNLLESGAADSGAEIRPAIEADLAAAGVPEAMRPAMTAGFETCFLDRAAAEQGVVPESCAAGEAALAQLAPLLAPGGAEAIGEAFALRGLEANQRNFSAALEQTLLWSIAGLGVIFLLTFLLPAKPREDMDLMAA